jgi:hypothetical protein
MAINRLFTSKAGEIVMSVSRTLKSLAAAATLGIGICVAPAAMAQDFPMKSGEYVEVGMIDVEDGGSYDYAVFLASQWKSNQEFAKSKGWISGYEVLANVNPRPGEPDLLLVTRFAAFADAAEGERRAAAYREHMKKSDKQMETESGDRVKMRTVMGSQLWQQLLFK